jgi:hypothetical protein
VRFSILVDTMSAGVSDTAQGGGENVIDSIKTAETPVEAISIINRHFCAKLSRLLMADMEEFQMGARNGELWPR